jgi:hypothetical protein
MGANQNVVDVLLGIEPKGLSNFNKALTQVSVDAMTTMSKRGAEKFLKEMKTTYGKLEKAQLESARVLHKLESAKLTEIQRRQLSHRHQMLQTDIKGIEKKSRLELAGAEKVAKRRKAHFEKQAKTQDRIGKVGAVGEQFGEEISKAFTDMTSKDIGQMFKGPLTQMGTLTKKMGAALSKRSEPDSMAGKLGGILGKLGPALIAIGAIAAGFAAMLKIIIDADAQAKEFNKTLLESGASAGELVSGFAGITGNLRVIREAFTDFSFNRIWGTTAKDHLEMLGAYAGAGLTFKELTRNIDDAAGKMEALQRATASTLTYAKLFGQTNTEMAGNMGQWMEELGHNFETVSEALTGIHKAAMDSGFGVKRFYGMILQATSGMSMYNVRLSETAGLLTQLAKVLGPGKGGEFLQTLMGGYKESSTEDRTKTVMRTGENLSIKILRKGATDAAEDFQKKMEGADSGAAIGAEIEKALGLKQGQAATINPEKLMEKLGTLPDNARDDLVFAIQALDAPLARQMAAVTNKSIVAKGGRGAAQASLQFASPAETLAIQLNELQEVIGGRVDQISLDDEKTRNAWEKITGKQGEAAIQLWELGNSAGAASRMLESAQERLKKTPGDIDKINEELHKQGYELDAKGKAYKVEKKESAGGEVYWKPIGRAIGTEVEDIILGSGAELANIAKDRLPADLAMAQDVVRNTTEMTKILEQGVQRWLERIYGGVQDIIRYLGGGEDIETRRKLQNETEENLMTALKKKRGEEKKISGWSSARANATPEERAELDVKIKAAQKTIARQDIEIARAEKESRNLAQLEVGGFFSGSKTEAEMREAAGIGKGTGQEMPLDPELRKKGVESARRKGGIVGEKAADSFAPSMRKTGSSEEAIERTRDAYRTKGGEMAVAQLEAKLEGGEAQKPEWPSRGEKVGDTRIGGTGLDALWEHIEANYSPERTIKALDKLQAEKEVKEASRQAVLDQAETKWFTTPAEKKRAKILAMEIVAEGKKAEKEEQLEKIAKYLEMTGLSKSDAKKGAKSLTGAGGYKGDLFPADRAAIILRDLGMSDALDPGSKYMLETKVEDSLPGGPTKDMVMQIGRDGKTKFAQRVDGDDIVKVSKPGGALSKVAGGGGGGVNVYHLYGEGPGVLNTITKAQQSGLLS